MLKVTLAMIMWFSSPAAGIPIQLRLTGGEQQWIGRVELRINGIWGQVCDGNEWDESASEVVCRQLGYAGVLGEVLMSAPVLVMWESHDQ